jgi:hypothetical protein
MLVCSANNLLSQDAQTKRFQISRAFRINPLTPELNPSAQRCLTRLFTGDFAS